MVEWEESVEGMAKLVDLVWSEEFHLGLDLNEEQMNENDVDDQPTPIVKLPQACDYAQLLWNFVAEQSSEFSIIDVTNMQSFMYELNEISISNINKHHQKTIDSYLIVCDMVKTSCWDYKKKFKLHIVWCREHKIYFHTRVSSSCIQNDNFPSK